VSETMMEISSQTSLLHRLFRTRKELNKCLSKKIYASGVEEFNKTNYIDIAFGTAEWDGPAT
jgi:hypothetical protein